MRDIFTNQLGFNRVQFSLDDGRQTLLDKIDKFIAEARNYDIRVIYYSGHGTESNVNNYILPVDYISSGVAALYRNAVPLSLFFDHLNDDSERKAANVFILDACRVEAKGSGDTFKFVDGKLPRNTIVLHAASRGEVAIDGGGNGHFTGILKKYIVQRGLTINKVMGLTTEDFENVYPSDSAPNINQRPLGDEIYLNGEPEDILQSHQNQIPALHQPVPNPPPLYVVLDEPPVQVQLSAEECDKRGEDYYYGRGVTQSYTEAVKWYRKSAEQGNARAQYNLGYCYHYGQGVEQSYTEAVKWHRKSAAQGDERAKAALRRL
jgi:hypothetical protein